MGLDGASDAEFGQKIFFRVVTRSGKWLLAAFRPFVGYSMSQGARPGSKRNHRETRM